MNICIPKERRDSEYRVGLTPAGVRLLTAAGHTCFVERQAGVGSGFSDYDYQQAGGQIVQSSGGSDEEVPIAAPHLGRIPVRFSMRGLLVLCERRVLVSYPPDGD